MSSPHHHRRGTGGRGSSPLEERPYRGNAHRSPAVLRSQQREVRRDEIDDAIDGAWDDQEEEERRREKEERRREREREERRAREHQRRAQERADIDAGVATARAGRQALADRRGGVRRRRGIAQEQAQQGHASPSRNKRSSNEHVGIQTDSEGGEQAGWNPAWDDAIDGGWSDEDATNARAEEVLTHGSRRSSHGARR